MSLCEVRIPTYKRPDLLRRALNSLVKQTHKNWKAIVMDDSPEREGEPVVTEFKDNRIVYQYNEANLGRAKNLNSAFYTKSYVDGLYACVLEDDNYFFPDFIAENIKSVEAHQVNIVLRNQEIRLEKNGASLVTNTTTRGRWFEGGIYNPLQIQARLFFCEGISNGGLFWHTGRIQSNFQVSSQIDNSWHQEVFRTLQIKEPIFFEPKPLCVFTEFFSEESSNHTPYNVLYKKYKIFMGGPQHNRGTQAILSYLTNKYGSNIVREAQQLASKTNAEKILERHLINSFYLNYKFSSLSKLEFAQYLIKFTFRRLLVRNTYKEILNLNTVSN